MECPKCRKKISDDEYTCPFCSTKLKEAPKKKRSLNLFGGKKPKKNRRQKNVNTGKEVVKQGFDMKFKLLALGLCVILVIVIIAVVFGSLMTSEGEKYAEYAAEFIGNDIKKLESENEMHFSDESAFYGVNSAVAFDYIYESEDDIKAGGISYPEWAVFANTGKEGFITDVIYTDFTVVKKDMRGIKRKGLVDLDTFKKGDKQNSVLKSIDMRPYSISYSQSGIITYTYKYYFKRDNGDEQAVILRAAFNEKGKYQYYTTELIFPDNM
ncbi:MAG: hypothetical protein ACI4JW_03190 [Oscillospiraceae bacterium]